jgi:hypothetical protein
MAGTRTQPDFAVHIVYWIGHICRIRYRMVNLLDRLATTRGLRMRFALAMACLTLTSIAQAQGLSAQASAQSSAQCGRIAHRGGSYRYEGVGFSTASAQAAIRNCCYYGQRTPVEIGVSRGRNGWYACVRYR